MPAPIRLLLSFVVLALALGPVANAMCVHMEHEETAHEMPRGHDSETPPCHDAPKPDPVEAPADCVSVCCANAVAEDAAAPAVTSDLEVGPAVTEVRVLEAPASPRRPNPTTSPPSLELHVMLERFLI